MTALTQHARRLPPPSPGEPSARRFVWRGRQWDDMPRWQRLCAVLDLRGPQTTGVLGHIKGIGENVRGIRREANRNLARLGLEIVSEPTHVTDFEGEPIHNATYRLVDRVLAEHLARTEAELAERRRAVAGSSVAASGGGLGLRDDDSDLLSSCAPGNVAQMETRSPAKAGMSVAPTSCPQRGGPATHSVNHTEGRPVSPHMAHMAELDREQEERERDKPQLGLGI